MTGSMLLGCGGEKEKEDGKTSDGKVQLRFATWDDATALDSQQECVDKFH